MTITDKQRTVFQKVFDLVPYKCNSVFIAGGAVVDLDKASDIDIWIGMDKEKVAHNVLAQMPLKYQHFGKAYSGSNFKVIGTGFMPSIGKLVQVMLCNDKSAKDLMETFDISTHQWAVTALMQVVQGKHATEANEPPKILNSNPQTFQRYVKICQRYGHEVSVGALKPHCHDMKMFPDPMKKPAFDKTTISAVEMKETMVKLWELSQLAAWAPKYTTNIKNNKIDSDHPF